MDSTTNCVVLVLLLLLLRLLRRPSILLEMMMRGWQVDGDVPPGGYGNACAGEAVVYTDGTEGGEVDW